MIWYGIFLTFITKAYLATMKIIVKLSHNNLSVVRQLLVSIENRKSENSGNASNRKYTTKSYLRLHKNERPKCIKDAEALRWLHWPLQYCFLLLLWLKEVVLMFFFFRFMPSPWSRSPNRKGIRSIDRTFLRNRRIVPFDQIWGVRNKKFKNSISNLTTWCPWRSTGGRLLFN